LILIDIAAYAHDTKAQMEEMLTMDSHNHPREHDHVNDVHPGHRDASDHGCPHPFTPVAYTGDEMHNFNAAHEGNDVAQEPGDELSAQGPHYSGTDRDVYGVLLAVERGELSPQDAARKLEELEAVSLPSEAEDGELI
jgi:hypothetical protein